LKVVNLERWCFFLVICQEEAMAWFERMHEAGCVPDGVTYSTMLDVYGRMGKYDEAIALYKNLRKAAWKPDKVTYGTMVRLFGRAGYLRAALTTFQEMKASGVQADSIVYNILISCLGRAGSEAERCDAKHGHGDVQQVWQCGGWVGGFLSVEKRSHL
jgi:pentatricopeptide repeat protein